MAMISYRFFSKQFAAGAVEIKATA